MAKFDFNPKEYQKKLKPLLKELVSGKVYDSVLRRYPKTKTRLFTKAEIISGLKFFKLPLSLIAKPIRTSSGVVPVTVLTKPYPCPGNCLYCPNDPKMPKSYLSLEPGAQRAATNHFDPFKQVNSRLITYLANNHSVAKIELIILGGTWSFYPKTYQTWFIKRCFDALNKKTSSSLSKAQKLNETAIFRCVGLSLETRPDYITPTELIRFRKLGCTKVQIGLQSLSDKILSLNNRGHNVSASQKAIKLLRQFGFKIQAHWMANLYGSDPKKDFEDFNKLFKNKDFRPDELKIYPCSLIRTSPLYQKYKAHKWQPYTTTQLLDLIVKILPLVPAYCRVSRMIRDFSASDIVVGNKTSNLRQLIEAKLVKQGTKIQEIRFREIRHQKISLKNLKLDQTTYQTSIGTEIFFQYITPSNQIAAFLRLSLPQTKAPIKELINSAIIREVHVYGPALDLGAFPKAQHLGLGTLLIKEATKTAKKYGYKNLSVISSIGTRPYYRRQGFSDNQLYQYLKVD